MFDRARIAVLAATATTLMVTTAPLAAADLPRIKAGGDNQVPACVTPGRLGQLLKARNGELDARFEAIAVEYMRHGEALGIRWDIAFYQMLVETGSLKFGGDVKPDQNNFAGLGATGGGVRGERFDSVSDGVKAHLQHIVMYTGERVADPVAERTRRAQDGRWLDGWRNGIGRPLTFTDLARKWAPPDRGYSRDIATIAGNFRDDYCGKPDPAPQLVALARGQTPPVSSRTADAGSSVAPAAPSTGSIGEELKRQAVERAQAEGRNDRVGLGGPATIGGVKILNKSEEAPPAAAAEAKPGSEKPASETSGQDKSAGMKPTDGKSGTTQRDTGRGEQKKPEQVMAAVTGGALQNPAPAPAQADPAAQVPAGGCKVWTASYGGRRSVIIRQDVDRVTNFTVLDVNEGNETREVETYIATYAKNGKKIADFTTPQQALERAFQLCPEG